MPTPHCQEPAFNELTCRGISRAAASASAHVNSAAAKLGVSAYIAMADHSQAGIVGTIALQDELKRRGKRLIEFVHRRLLAAAPQAGYAVSGLYPALTHR